MRLDHYTCAICMESLFNRRDDLDEIWTIATPDCGHVAHEKCLLQWFRTQSQTYIAQQREHRSVSPSASEAPAECPTCRTECYADPDTGQPIVHRLYLNTDGSGGYGWSSQAGSSPVKAQTPWRKGKEAELMGYARRAKGLTEEVRDLSAGREVGEEEVGGVRRRAEGLEGDLISQKGVEGIRKYVGGLTAALNNLRTSLVSNPLIPTLRAALQTAQTTQTDLQRRMQELVHTHMPAEIARAVQVEQARCDRKVKKVQDDMERVKAELDRETVLRRTARKEMDERLQAEARKTKEAVEQASKEKESRETLNTTLLERTKQLRVFQQKAEARKELKAQLQEVQAENASLKQQLEDAAIAARTSRRRPSSMQESSPFRRGSGSNGDMIADGDMAEEDDMAEEEDMAEADDFDTDDEESSGRADQSADLSIVEIDPDNFYSKRKRPTAEQGPRKQTQDESLEVDMSSFAPSSSSRHPNRHRQSSHLGTTAGASRSTRHPTARVVPSDQFASKKESKYFGASRQSRESVHDDAVPENVPVKRSRTNPFQSDKANTERKKVLSSTSSTRPREVLDLADTDESASEAQTSKPRETGIREPLAPKIGQTAVEARLAARSRVQGSTVLAKQRSMVDFLGLADKSGRPLKGVVGGTKVKRKA